MGSSSRREAISSLDAELIAVYLDGELDPSLRKRVDDHLQHSPVWKSVVERQQTVRRWLHSDPNPDPSVAMERVWARIVDDSARIPFWRRTISVPLPALAGSLAVVLFFVLSFVYMAARGPVGRMQITTAPSGVKQVQVEAPIQELEALLRSLESGSASRELIIELPANSRVLSIGEPVLLREADLVRSGLFR